MPDQAVDPQTWTGIVALPDDVSLRTSDRHGEALRHAQAAWRHWLGLVVDVQRLHEDPERDALAVAARGAAEEFQASVYAALTGFYRQAIGVLRAPVEAMLAAADFSARPNLRALDLWLQGHEDGRFQVTKVRRELSAVEPYKLFEQDEGGFLKDGGWYAWLYGILCAFVHGRPTHTDHTGVSIETTNGGMWKGNGPVYVPRAFVFWSVLFFDSLLLCTLLAGLTNTRLVDIPHPSDIHYETYIEKLMGWHPDPGPPPTAAVIVEHLMPSRLS